MSLHRINPFGRWLLRVLLWLLPLGALWWWLGGAEWVLRALRMLANAIFPGTLLQDVSEIVLQADQSWKFRTSLIVQNNNEQSKAIFFFSRSRLLRTVLGFPLLWALLLATSGRWFYRLMLATALLVVVSLFCIAAQSALDLAVLVNHQPSVIDQSLVPPPYQVTGKPYPTWLFYVFDFLSYLGILIVPVIAPVLIWLLLCPRGVMRLLVSLQQSVRVKATR